MVRFHLLVLGWGLSRLTAKPPSHDPRTRMAPLPFHVEGVPGSFCAFPALDLVSAISPRTLMFTDHGLGARTVVAHCVQATSVDRVEKDAFL